MNRVRVLLFILLLAGLIAGCSSGETAEPAAETATSKIEVQNAWGRTSPAVAENGAFYMNLVNNTVESDTLVSAASDACEVVELHEMYMMDNGAMGMRPVEGGEIPVPSGQTVELKPGGMHVMCLGKTADFNVGDQYTLNLEFAKAGSIAVTVDIREMAEPSAADAASGKMEVLEAWGRTSPKVAENGAFYMKLVNNTDEDDKLLSATAEACDVVELHEMYVIEEGVMGMRPVEAGYIPVAAGETVELKVGGLHVMCIGKLADFNVGDTYPVSLAFEKAGTIDVTVEIRETEMPAEMNMEGKSQ